MGFDWPVYAALAMVLALMALPIVSRKLHGPIEYIVPNELYRRLDDGERFTLVDLRPRKAFDVYHITGAESVPRRELGSYLASLRTDGSLEGRPVVLICQSDLDSIRMVKHLKHDGFDDILVLNGGMFKWKRDRLPLERR